MLLSNFYVYLSIGVFVVYFISMSLYIRKIHKEEYSPKRELFLIITLFVFVLLILYISFLGKQSNQVELQVELNQNIKEKGVTVQTNIYIFQHKRYIKNRSGDYILIND